MSEHDKGKDKDKDTLSEDEVQDLDLDAEEGKEITERVRGGQRAISIPF